MQAQEVERCRDLGQGREEDGHRGGQMSLWW